MALPPRPYDTELMHHGVKGQKWGVRKPEPGSSNSPVKRVTAHPDHPSYLAHPATLSDQELQRRLNRIRMEQQYTTLVSDMQTASEGKQAVDRFIATYKTASDIYNMANTPMAKMVRKAITKAARSYVNNKLPG